MRKLESEIADIENHGELRVLIARDVCVFLEAHDIGVVDERLVEVLEEVAGKHQRYNTPVDFTLKSTFVIWLHWRDIAALPKELKSSICSVNVFDHSNDIFRFACVRRRLNVGLLFRIHVSGLSVGS